MTTSQVNRFAFFGTIPLAEGTLNALEKAGYLPSLIVAASDSLDRKKNLVFPMEKRWAIERNIKVVQPEKITSEFIAELRAESWDFFVVASYGKILPKALLDIPKHGVINIHPSLLPYLRGPSPIRSAILLDQRETGISIMLMDEKMDHGPLIAQKKIAVEPWPPRGRELDDLLAREGGDMLAEIVPKWLAGEITPKEQDHTQATFTKLFNKEDGELNLADDGYHNLLKIRAFDGWPGTFAFFERSGERIRALILDAHMEGKKLVIDTVKPEGKGEMPYADFLRSGAKPL